jgi:tripartite-type tricarboxylate transporter receptor subunit TctC
VWVPAKTPQPIAARLHQEIVKVLHTPQTKERLFNSGVEVVASTPDEFTREIKAEVVRLDKVIKATGLRAN